MDTFERGTEVIKLIALLSLTMSIIVILPRAL